MKTDKQKGCSCPCGETNPEQFYKNTTKKCRKCQAEISRLRYVNKSASEKKAYIAQGKGWRENNIIRIRLIAAKNRAIKKGLDFDIDEPFIIEMLAKQNNRCKYSKLLLDLSIIGSEKGFLNNYTLSIDRVNSKGGYTKDNVVLVAGIVNAMKNDLEETEFLNVIKAIYLANFSPEIFLKKGGSIF
jgi:hypothetical protein